MTEEEWLACADPTPMLKFLRGRASDRKLRLFACGCCRRHKSVLRGKRNLQTLEASEEFADGRMTRKDMRKVRENWYVYDYPFPLRGTWQAALSHATILDTGGWSVANDTAPHAAQASPRPEREQIAQAGILRDIFGNPFRPVAVDPAWLTSTVVALAEGIYAERAFDRLPILADALQDAGCENGDVLTHLRGDGPHVRGCWALDLVLGKS
jgi:hypothetical protein